VPLPLAWMAERSKEARALEARSGCWPRQRAWASRGAGLWASTRNGDESGLGDRAALAERAGQQTRRERRRPPTPSLRIPDRPTAPRERAQDEKRNAVSVATLSAARPCRPQRTPAGDAGQGWPEAPADPSDHRQEAEDTDHAGQLAGGCERERVRPHPNTRTRRLGRTSESSGRPAQGQRLQALFSTTTTYKAAAINAHISQRSAD
jgi:hypothetical protein